jgi:CCR4-NOT transcription complex subunit 9
MKMLQSQQHVFSHQHQYGNEPSWLHQQQAGHHTQQHPNFAAQQHAQAQAAAAAATAAQQQQQQHYNRMEVNRNSNGANSVTSSVDTGQANGDGGISEENRKVLGWVAELMDGNRRESALMELSKKREQVPELALIIWHSFGK